MILVGNACGFGGATGAAFGATCFGSILSLTTGLAAGVVVGVGADTFGSGGVAKSAFGVFVDLTDSFSFARMKPVQ